MMRHLPLAFAAVLALAMPTARASVVLDLTVAEMVQKSACVVHGTVEEARAAWSGAEKREIHTHVKLRVGEAWKCPAGVVEKRAVVIRQLGGAVDGLTMQVPGAPEFTVGEEVVVFLSPARGEPGAFVLLTLGAAKFTVAPASGTARAVTRNLAGLAFARSEARGPIRVLPPRAASIPQTLEDLVREIRANLK